MSHTRYPMPAELVRDGLRLPARIEVAAPGVVYESVTLKPLGGQAMLSVVQLDPTTLQPRAAMLVMDAPGLRGFIAVAQRVLREIEADGA